MFPSSSSCRCFTLLFFFLIFIHQLSPSIANLHTLNTNPILKSSLRSPPPPSSPLSDDLTAAQSPPPTVFFEVTKPIPVPKSQPCKYLILQHDFGFTYSKPPVIANYTFPSHCRRHGGFSKAVLEWNATCKGRQFDRIFGVWLSGVELLRSCTAEPRPNGIFWSVKKDITRYSSLLLSNDTLDLAVFLGNVVDSTYTGIYHVNVSIYFYSDDNEQSGTNKKLGPADLILPISRTPPLNDGLWFEIQNSNQESFKEFVIPLNVHRAVLEVYVSFHESDEFWFTNFPNDYIVANNISGALGNGPFREVVVSLDDNVTVGAVWPFTVIYTGGANPLLWRPISAIGSFDLPTYDIEITPFLGSLLDGKTHKLGFSVTNALNVWFIDANLHLWLDHQSARTEGVVINHRDRLDLSSQTNFKGLDGRFLTGATRIVSSKGWVKSSLGNITTHFTQHFSYDNVMELGKDGNLQTVRQVILSNDSSSSLGRSRNNFSLDFYSDFKEQPDNAGSYIINLTLGYDTSKSDSSNLRNRQSAQGVMLVKNNLVVSGVGATQQVYKYNSRESCYFRNISSFNYTILFDKEGSSCSREKQQPPLGLKVAKLWPFPSRRRSFMSSSTSSSSSVLPDGH
ncbi:Peptide-N4-(N-acetyl-beta-glucosaminyl)asparagineamidase A [Linum perenne]